MDHDRSLSSAEVQQLSHSIRSKGKVKAMIQAFSKGSVNINGYHHVPPMAINMYLSMFVNMYQQCLSSCTYQNVPINMYQQCFPVIHTLLNNRHDTSCSQLHANTT